ncbi:hypothetical protein MUB23_19190 [Cuneatibacter sp. NSJ-177]|uniref:pyroglutamyl-peptidase I family protein n=1 Tax=Cuneatibacter sp. NSJ-177 TaxID=2931401 RepID=UPI001FD58DB6|nr:hypothetical protein [Cuneatibacter sp. NSJ-177]MCJ7837504.1 hypothetical protein [Cuneatibacter sp. NSJ-177]
MKKPTILVTGFQPFLGQEKNSSGEAVRLLPKEVSGCRIETRILPVKWFGCVDELEKALAETKPDVWLGTGQGYPVPPLLIERVGLNLASGPDGDFEVDLREQPIFAGGPAAYFSSFPYEAVHQRLKKEGIPVRYSFSAGQNQCNCVLYAALHFAATRYPGLQAGFLHLPMVPDGTRENTMTPQECARALVFCLEEIGRTLTLPVRSLDEYRESL